MICFSRHTVLTIEPSHAPTRPCPFPRKAGARGLPRAERSESPPGTSLQKHRRRAAAGESRRSCSRPLVSMVMMTTCLSRECPASIGIICGICHTRHQQIRPRMRTCIHCIQIWPLVTREESGIFVRLCRGEAVGHTYGPLFRHAQQDPSPLVSPRRTSFFFLSLGLSPCRSIAFLQQAPFIYCCCPR